MQAPLQARNDSDAAQTDTARTVAQKRVLVDNRSEAAAQRKLVEMMNNSLRVLPQRALSDAIHNSPRMVAQRHEMNALFGGTVKSQGDGAMPAEASLAQREEKTNKTGLPNQLKSGIESLSGMSMDHVTVHYNSDKPAQLQAHAYAQGSEIHLGAGQERHLPHEAWHIVQQAQGRVWPTLQMKTSVINDDPLLEKEADIMGDKAVRFEHNQDARAEHKRNSDFIQGNTPSTGQRQSAGAVWPVQLQQTVSGHGCLRRDAQGNLVKYTVPVGKKVIRAAPPGATLGDISMLMNETSVIDPVAMRARVKVNTTDEFWGNIPMANAVKDNPDIPKTKRQVELLNEICNRKTIAWLTGPDKNSLRSLEKKPKLENWAQTTVAPETFKEINATEAMDDIVLSEFEDKLKSQTSAAQNYYITGNTTLSDHIKNNTTDNEFVVNACSHDPNATYTGFQIDG